MVEIPRHVMPAKTSDQVRFLLSTKPAWIPGMRRNDGNYSRLLVTTLETPSVELRVVQVLFFTPACCVSLLRVRSERLGLKRRVAFF
jgi:hypothetical protein